MAQVSILLSFWSPCDSESQVNSHWIAKGFDHTRQVYAWIERQEHDRENWYRRWNILRWRCLIRERMVAVGMRRPERLLKVEALPPLPTEAELGIKDNFSRCIEVARKRAMVKLFLLFCKLSIIMEYIVVFQRRVRYAQLWDAENRELVQEIEQVVGLDRRLTTWKVGLNYIVRDQTERFSMVYVLQIMCE